MCLLLSIALVKFKKKELFFYKTDLCFIFFTLSWQVNNSIRIFPYECKSLLSILGLLPFFQRVRTSDDAGWTACGRQPYLSEWHGCSPNRGRVARTARHLGRNQCKMKLTTKALRTELKIGLLYVMVSVPASVQRGHQYCVWW